MKHVAIAALATVLLATGLPTAKADTASDGQAAMEKVTDPSESFTDRLKARNEALDAAEKLMDEAFGDSGDADSNTDAND